LVDFFSVEVDVEFLDSSPSLPPVEEELDVVSVKVVEVLGRWENLSMASALVKREKSKCQIQRILFFYKAC
jgi:hypothetical protein